MTRALGLDFDNGARIATMTRKAWLQAALEDFAASAGTFAAFMQK
ncbi:hypothetical protein RFM41_27240 [Mesorhizobium sp. VK25A]|uniref:Uncharacterized protein n=1 Tax=Mesorhizobium vachelliae TaxID=3072309 RepID=A0ABU5AAC4_9HYPH|nr:MULTISPECIES: hypothetical protein [unclassified Mesorhizobium]MDX8534645.1 hypothetical protein [Mesorhizobium sp. VK25D]MDX8547472.1 hypothetical protein [Mesorhizobium sp. VK25A]